MRQGLEVSQRTELQLREAALQVCVGGRGDRDRERCGGMHTCRCVYLWRGGVREGGGPS